MALFAASSTLNSQRLPTWQYWHSVPSTSSLLNNASHTEHFTIIGPFSNSNVYKANKINNNKNVI